MFTSVSLENFKCFSSEQKFNLNKVNVFTGYNGRGKSTVFQAFLLMAQSVYDNKSLKDLLVNGIFCKLGLFEDLIHHSGNTSEISFRFTTDGEKNNNLVFTYKELSDRKGTLSNLIVDGKGFFETATQLGGEELQSKNKSPQSYPEDIHAVFDNFYFVSADRLGPTPFEVKCDLYENNPIGNSGEFRLNVLAGHRDAKEQVAKAIAEIMDGGMMSVKGDSDKEKSNDVLNLYFSSLIDGTPVKSINCGFGYSYIIPILLAAVSMNGGCLFVENPEAHLHPCAQSQLIKTLVSLCGRNRIQLFIETHSEHVINALRLCSLEDQYADFIYSDLAMYFFDKDMTVKPLQLEADGQVSEWPLGFFDQAERDAARIIQLGLMK